MGRPERFTIERLRRIGDVDAGDWDRLAANDVYARHGWLSVVEDAVCEADDPVYFLLRDGEALAGAAVCYRLNAVGSSLDEVWLGRLHRPLARIGVSLSPALYCGPMLGQGRHVLWDRAEPAPQPMLQALLDAITDFAAAERLTLAFAKLPADEHVLLSALAGRGFARTSNWPVSYLDIRWESLDAYLAHLAASGSGMATKARREIAAPEKVGVRLSRVTAFRDLADDLFALVEANQRAHTDAPLGLKPQFFRTLADHHGEASLVTVARAGDTVAGAALLLTAGDCAGGPLIGVSEDARHRKGFTYFNLALYEPVRLGIERGLKRVYLGAGLYDMKRRRGCNELELAMLVRPSSNPGRAASRVWSALHRRWARRKLERQGVRFPRSPAHR